MRAIAAALALALPGCLGVHVNDDGSRVVRSFGATTTLVESDGTITASSDGLSMGVVGGVSSVVTTAGDVFLALLGRGPTIPAECNPKGVQP